LVAADSHAAGRPDGPRRALAVAEATLAAVIAYWAVVIAVAAASDTGTVEGTGFAVAIGFLLIPIAFLILARVSRRRRPVRAALIAAASALVVWAGAQSFIGELAVPFVAAVGGGGAFALRADPPQRVGHRLIGALLATLYIAIIVKLAFGLALILAPFLPLPTLLAADYVSERRAT